MKTKIYTINKTHPRRGTKMVSGTLDELIKHFGYTLECGKSWNFKINSRPSTIKSFVSNLQKSYAEREHLCYERTHVSLVQDIGTSGRL